MIFLYFFLSLVSASNYILTPKQHLSMFVDYSMFSNIQSIYQNDNLHVYKTSSDNYIEHQSTFDIFFDIEPEQIYSINYDTVYFQYPGTNHFFTSTDVPWHLDRIDKRSLPLTGSFDYSEQNSCHTNSNIDIHTYVVDTGCDVNHTEFDGRANFLDNFTDDNQNYDGNSHGTHCSGLIGSKTYGVCKDAKIFCIKVLDSQGRGTTSGVIAGMNLAFKTHLKNSIKNPNIRSIMSMSLGGSKSLAMNRVIEKMIEKSNSFYIVVASGNENNDACETSPASAHGIFTVNAMNRFDQRAYFSNYGKCTDIYTPGVNILSTIPNNKTAVYSGTSMSTPILAGILNHYLDMYPDYNMAKIKKQILKDATKDSISNNPFNTNNLLAYLHRH